MRFSLTAALIGAAALVSSVSADLYDRLNLDDAAILFVDHQTGLFSLVQDFNPESYQQNVMGLAAAAKYYNVSTILTTSREDGPNGPMLPQLKAMFPEAPYIPRPGQINAWDDEDFVKAVMATGKRQLIVSGIVTDVCVTFVALSARKAGFEVFVVTDASGTNTEAVRQASWMRMQAAGVQLMNWFSVACELGRDWRRDLEGMGKLFHDNIPSYGHIMDSFNGAQAAMSKSMMSMSMTMSSGMPMATNINMKMKKMPMDSSMMMTETMEAPMMMTKSMPMPMMTEAMGSPMMSNGMPMMSNGMPMMSGSMMSGSMMSMMPGSSMMMSKSMDMPMMTDSMNMPMMTESMSMPMMTQSMNMPMMAESMSMPIMTQSMNMPMMTESMDQPMMTMSQ